MKRWGQQLVVPAAALGILVLGLVVRQFEIATGNLVWSIGLALTGFPVVVKTVRGLVRGHFAADIVASLAILTALLLGTPFPGLIVVLMQTGGEALERHAEGRASTAVRDLEAMAPTIAHRMMAGKIEDIPVERIERDDQLLVRPGELIPCDAVVRAGSSSVDASRLTGEAIPITARPGIRLLSGSLNGTSPLTIQALAPSRDSQYARIVELVRTAQASKSPFQRMADRYAVWFTPLTLGVCGLAYAVSSDWQRVLAVLVVATPCPLILAAPVAIIGGINRAARRMIIFRTGGAIEALGTVTAVVFDKTGTLTVGSPEVSHIVPVDSANGTEILRLASGVEHNASHPMARTLVEAAVERDIEPPPATQVIETPGEGVVGLVEGREVAVGGRAWVTRRYPNAAEVLNTLGNQDRGLRAYVVLDGEAAAVIKYEDRMRPAVQTLVERLRALGLAPLVLLSGDHEENVSDVASALGIDRAHGDLLPSEKSRVVSEMMKAGHRVVMLGDGTNDAPALSTADVGVALATGGGGISAEAADVVLLADDPGRLAEAIQISRDTLHIARQSVWAGLGLSMIAMGFAAGGMIPPAVGAVLQEAIDVAVILNALRARAT